MSYKWKFKDVLTLSPTSSDYITIRSNGKVFSRINITASQLLYGQFIVYEASSGWTNEAYKIIEMDARPLGSLLQFLQSNAILLPSSNVNKVDLNGVTVLDLTSDTVTPETLLVGTTAHNAKGEIITGTLVARDSSDLTVSGATVNVPAGLYSSAASKSVASGTAGTPTASKSAVSNNSVTVTPSVTNTEGYITGGTKTGTGVKVSASELVSGNKAITPSETAQSGIDVTNFKTASVGAISSTYVGSGVTRKAAATVAPSTSEQTVCASGVYITGEQKVSAITPSIVGNLDASSFAASIVAAVEGKGVTVPGGTLLDGMAALIESIEAGGGINATAGTLNVSSDTNDYILTHGLGEVPKFFAIGMITNFTLLTGKNYILIGAYGFSDVDIQYRLSSSSSTNAPSGVLGEGAITDPYPRRCSLTQANEETINIATSSGTHKLIAGATYYWVAVGSGVF